MTAQITKDSIDLGIVVTDIDASLAFYRDLIGLADDGTMPVPGGMMYRLKCGTSVVKLISPKRPPANAAAPGGIGGANGYRYFTMFVSNLAEIVAECTAAGHTIAVPVTELRPGITIAIVEDPDGNWVEFVAGH